ncbi:MULTISPECIES: enoyl-CoA hydratase/isomerase family protein [unclassified Mesorhizobium]|uniref:enoyl-CoA hydratase/isomerase family protein n=1 Tax=unclassified Mesorhizobium TaxID=325217 RepID=UPI002417D5BA|nr:MULTISPECIES: enoyl-CoA hydratase/isomerase family protein [unclassified Mesorhizobium]WFP65600.1 enoyl-CoA hydratase/isomerase family protein [Mesorhizobium sp. WSM4904]WFP78864.1 enoyl-CoA hydratase/isomerase family protein [Mesorhizobium sp. WSM4906]
MAIDFNVDGPVATIRINRPEKLNALSLAMYEDLGRAFDEVRDDDRIRVAVLAGAGDRAFCVGADLKESIPALASDSFDISAWDPAHIKTSGFYKPVVGAIRGLCIGGGFELMLATDIRIVAEDAVFQLPEPAHGFVPAGGTLVRLVRQIGYAHAMEILLTGRRFTAAEMLAWGVANQAVASSEVERVARDIAERIASFSPTAIQTIKEAVLTLQHLPLGDAFQQEARLGQRTFTSDDAKRGLDAFANKGK